MSNLVGNPKGKLSCDEFIFFADPNRTVFQGHKFSKKSVRPRIYIIVVYLS